MISKLLELYRENPSQARLMGVMVGAFLLVYFLPAGQPRFDNAVLEAIRLTRWYAREHVILCLLPAFIIAGGGDIIHADPEYDMGITGALKIAFGSCVHLERHREQPIFGVIAAATRSRSIRKSG